MYDCRVPSFPREILARSFLLSPLLHPFFQRKPFPPYHRLEPPFPPPLPPRHLFDSLSKVYTLPICLFRRFHPPILLRKPRLRQDSTFDLYPVVSLQQSIPISRESVLNLAPSRVSRPESGGSWARFSSTVARGIRPSGWIRLFMRE